MRLAFTLVPALAFALALGACDKHETASNDARNVGRDVNHTLSNIGHDPTVRQAEAEFHQAARDAGHDLHHAADEARNAFHDLTHNATNSTAHHDRTDHHD